MPIIEFKNFSFAYPDKNENTIENIDFKIDEGEFVVMYGPTGSGKSTILRQIKRQIKPYGKSSGEILYFGKNIDEIDELTSVCEIGFVFQNPESQLVADTVWHELAFSLENIGLKTEDMRKKIGEMACFFGLENLLDKSVHELSGGQKQIVNLCSVLLLQPKVLILDEPISQLDPINAREFLKIIYQLIRDFDITVILSEHRLEDVYFLADKIVVIDDGRVKYDGVPDAVAISSRNDENLKDFLPELSKLYFRYETDRNADGIIPKTVRDYKNWAGKFDVIYSKLPPANATQPTVAAFAASLNEGGFGRDIQASAKDHSLPLGGRWRERAGGSKEAATSISCKDIYFAYVKNQPDILKGLEISVNKGEILSVLGGNGAGKSTLLKIMAGILKPQRGKVILHNKHVNIGYLAQNPKAYFLYDTVEKEIFERAKSLENPDYKYIDYLINLFKIEKILKLHPYDISGGEQQLTAFLTVMLTNPDILLLDEPTKGLDPNMKKAFFDILLKLVEIENDSSESPAISAVIATHDIEFAAKYSDSCCFLFDGEIMSKYPSKKFFADNYFYTTSISKIFRDYNKNIVCVEDVILNKREKQDK